ncbi:MAG: hypothetical protein ACRELB_08590, partial [Polyangiaceae bacterium]
MRSFATHIPTPLFAASAALLCATGSGTPACASSIVVPAAFAGTNGDTSNIVPFGESSPYFFSTGRSQTVYDTALFAALPAGGFIITGLDFRTNYAHAISYATPDIQIDLSTTAAAAGGLSATVADNVGANDTVVFGAGPLSFSAQSSSTLDFIMQVPLEHSFFYDPTKGNLLIDVRLFSAPNGFDGSTQATQVTAGVSRIFSNGDVNAATAGYFQPVASIMQVDYTLAPPAPEPGSSAIIAASLAALSAAPGRRRAASAWRAL